MNGSDNKQDNGGKIAEQGWQRPGIVLRKARLGKGLSEKDICGGLGWPVGVLQALEADDYARLPAAVYVRGYIRSYCALLGMPGQPVLECYQTYCSELERKAMKDAAEAPAAALPVWKKPLFWGALAVVAAILLLLIFSGAAVQVAHWVMSGR